jgi:hypothetical protein
MPLSMRADSTEYVTATVTADHDITSAAISVALPVTNTAPTTWYTATVTDVKAVAGRSQATYRILLGPAGGVTQLTAGSYDWTVRLTDNPGPEVPVRKAGILTITTT